MLVRGQCLLERQVNFLFDLFWREENQKLLGFLYYFLGRSTVTFWI